MATPKTSLLSTIPSDKARWNVLAAEELDHFNMDWMGKYRGKSSCVIKPKSAEELSAIMRICYENNIAIVPQGGNTGLVGGSVPVHDEVVVNLSSMNKIRSFDTMAGTLVCDAGCILEVLDDYVANEGYMMPLDLGAKGSCHIGGNVAANAGGLRFLRYGSLHGSVLGLEVVLPNGDIITGLQTLRKDNTGLDLKQLFIGSEGTLGIITGVSIATPPRPKSVKLAMFGLDSYEAVQQTFRTVRKYCGEILSAFEFVDADTFNVVMNSKVQSHKNPFTEPHRMYVLVETSGSNKEHDDEKMQLLLEELLESGLISDGVLAQDETQIRALWAIRENIPESLGHLGKVYKYDVSLPIEKMYDLVDAVKLQCQKHRILGVSPGEDLVLAVGGYGHIGDGNLHINVAAKGYLAEVENALEPFIYEFVASVRGSISAEHGLGLMKADKIGYSKDLVSIDCMKRIKRVFDPKGLLNPYKYLPSRN
ncbi:(R)-2-hydroxyglutarate--pyruvate transhydrogenase [Malassezia vespertilionis]|nr:(R)-2-hydroxyglutarate--pyruvate transhydrogenase [Malassezia vespertilionis]WFD04707.1 (R)-2-hydroxyglutarate--pyruvate transhydrogenase [Malassezia vespertilionis]